MEPRELIVVSAGAILSITIVSNWLGPYTVILSEEAQAHTLHITRRVLYPISSYHVPQSATMSVKCKKIFQRLNINNAQERCDDGKFVSQVATVCSFLFLFYSEHEIF